MTKTAACIASTLVLALASGSALASPTSTAPEAKPAAPTMAFGDPATDPGAPAGAMALPTPGLRADDIYERWYGRQVLVIDALAVAAVVVGVGMAFDEDVEGDTALAMLGLGAGTYVVGAPIVHAMHGNLTHGGLSLAARIGVPYVLASATGDGSMAVAGALSVAVVDAILSRESYRAPALAPVVRVGGGTTIVGLAGAL